MATKKIGSAGRFGARYGRKIKQKIINIERKQKKFHKCPSCGRIRVKRVAMGIWQCKKCNVKFAGRAYEV